MLHNLWIFKDTGECILSRDFGMIKLDENLVTSFLSALNLFVRNFEDHCEILETGKFKFVYHYEEDQIICVASIDKYDDVEEIKGKLRYLGQAVANLFGNKLDMWNGDVDRTKMLEEIVDTEFNGDTIDLSKCVVKLKNEPNRNQILTKSEQRIFSLVRYKGKIRLADVIELLKMNKNEVETATRNLIAQNILELDLDARSLV